MFSIVIPIFNEAQNIEPLLEEIHNSLKINKYREFELILVNDSSVDNSIKIINRLKAKFRLILINNRKNKGQSYSISQGINKSKYKTIVTLDGDGQNNPADIPLLLDKYFSDTEIYLLGGIRQRRKDNFIKIISSILANKIRSYILADGCKDTGCSLKVFDRDTFLKFPFFNGIHRFLPALFKGYGYKTDFINVSHRPRIKGKSKYGTLDRLFSGIVDMIKVKKIINTNNMKNI